eukprot:m.480840 g.480840  ORF g.480840 m.480840 type:complete len:79 (-) comp21711_c1_seq5:357-593(-)
MQRRRTCAVKTVLRMPCMYGCVKRVAQHVLPVPGRVQGDDGRARDKLNRSLEQIEQDLQEETHMLSQYARLVRSTTPV